MLLGVLVVLCCALAGYLLGAVPFGYLVARAARGIDIRQHGSGNIGATNIGRVVGKPYGVLVFLLDGAKGFAPTFLGANVPLRSVLGEAGSFYSYLPLICGAAAIAGHMWPVCLRFKGGKGVATGLGVFLALAPVPALIAFGTWFLVLAISRYVSVASIVAALALPVSFVLLEGAGRGVNLWISAFCGLAAAVVIIKHRSNIVRLMKGVEPRIWKNKR
jgi:glycerol-3-phosphate acyltransferase PlsY